MLVKRLEQHAGFHNAEVHQSFWQKALYILDVGTKRQYRQLSYISLYSGRSGVNEATTGIVVFRLLWV